MSATPSSELTIDVVSDVVCPWCFIGKRRVESAIALRPETAVTVRYRPFFLNPWIPREGISREQYLTHKFGSVANYMAMAPRVVAAARAEGLIYAIDAVKRQPNTIDCHRLILWASAAGTAARMKQRLMELYFTEGADLTDRAVLVAAAQECGLPAADVEARLAGEDDVDTVTREAEAIAAAGVTGVPYFILGGIYAVSGAREPDYLAEVMDRTIAERARRDAAEMAQA